MSVLRLAMGTKLPGNEIQRAGCAKLRDKKQPRSAQTAVALGNEHLSWYRELCQKVTVPAQILISSSLNLQVQVI